MKKKSFSLLEVMIAIAICLSVAGGIGWKLQGLIEKKRFRSSVEKLTSRLKTVRQLAMNMQADFTADLTIHKGTLFLKAECTESPNSKGLRAISLGNVALFLEGEKKEKISFVFTSTGDILPGGRLEIRGKEESKEVVIFDLFSVQGGSKGGPMHPDHW